MALTRRQFLITGSGAGAALLLAACDQNSQAASISAVDTPAAGAADAPAPVTGAFYDGSPVPPLSSAAIYNPDGLPDRPLGAVDASKTMIEYISPTCPHCANFHMTVYPQIVERYVDTGELIFVSRPFIRNVPDAVIYMLAESAGSGAAYFDILSTYLATQNQWAVAENPRAAIFEIAQQFGFTQERFEQVLSDQDLFAALEAIRDQALNQFGLTGTPSFYLNGERYSGNYDFESLSAAIDAA